LKSDTLTIEEKSKIKTVVGGDPGEVYYVGLCATQVADYKAIDGGELQFDQEAFVTNLKLKSSAASEPSRRFRNWLQHQKTERVYELERLLERKRGSFPSCPSLLARILNPDRQATPILADTTPAARVRNYSPSMLQQDTRSPTPPWIPRLPLNPTRRMGRDASGRWIREIIPAELTALNVEEAESESATSVDIQDEDFLTWFDRWKTVYGQLSRFYNSKSMKKRRFDLERGLRHELDLGVNATIKTGGGLMGRKSDGTILFAFGDCVMSIGKYSSSYRYLVTKLRSLGHKVVFYPEKWTSQRFPMTGEQMQASGSNQVRIVY
jgi:hypothetical protein